MDLGRSSFQSYLNIFLRVQVWVQSRKSSRILQRRDLFIMRLLRKDQRNNFCLRMVWGQVQDNLRPQRQKQGIWMVGNIFFRMFLSIQKSFSLLLTQAPSGLVVREQRTQLGTKGLGLTTSWPVTATSNYPCSLGLFAKVLHLMLDLKCQSTAEGSLATGTRMASMGQVLDLSLLQVGDSDDLNQPNYYCFCYLFYMAKELKADMKLSFLLFIFERIQSGPETMLLLGLDGFCQIFIGGRGWFCNLLGPQPINYQKSRSSMLGLGLELSLQSWGWGWGGLDQKTLSQSIFWILLAQVFLQSKGAYLRDFLELIKSLTICMSIVILI